MMTRILRWLFMALIAFAALFPLAWMAIAGFKGRTAVLRSPFQFFPDVWRWQNYTEIAQDSAFSKALLVTFIGAVIFTAASLFVNSMAAYAFARLDFVGKQFWWVYCLMPMFIP